MQREERKRERGREGEESGGERENMHKIETLPYPSLRSG